MVECMTLCFIESWFRPQIGLMWLGIPWCYGPQWRIVADGVKEGEIESNFFSCLYNSFGVSMLHFLSIQEEMHETYLSVNFSFLENLKWEREERGESWRKKQIIHNLPFSICNLNPYKCLFGSSRRYFCIIEVSSPGPEFTTLVMGSRLISAPGLLAWPLYNSKWRPWFVAYLFLYQ